MKISGRYKRMAGISEMNLSYLQLYIFYLWAEISTHDIKILPAGSNCTALIENPLFWVFLYFINNNDILTLYLVFSSNVICFKYF